MRFYWLKIKAKWSNLKPREQSALMIGGVFVAGFFIYQFIWSALLNHTETMRHKIASKQKTLIEMQELDTEIQKIEGHHTNETVTPATLISFLQKQIDQMHLESQLWQASDDAVAMHFQKVEFDQFIRLITLVLREQSVSIAKLSVSAQGGPGMVEGEVVFQRLQI